MRKSRRNSQLNFPGNPRKFRVNLSQENPVKMSTAFPWGISQYQFRGTLSEEFLVTHSEEIEFLVTNSAQKNWRKCRQNLWKFLGISSKKFFRTNSWEFPGNYSQDFLQGSTGISWNILSIFLSKFTNQDFGPIVVNNLTTILPLKLFRSITIFLNQNVIVVFDLTEVVMYFVQTTELPRKNKKNEKKISKYFFKKMVLK